MRALVGVNLPWLFGAYGHDLAPSAHHPDWPCDFHLLRAYRPLLEAQALGFGAVRIWLCEGAEGLLVGKNGEIEGVHSQLLDSIRRIEEGAAITGMRVYWGLLDANAAWRDGDTITRSILANEDAADRFAERVVAQVARVLDAETTVALEIVNEPETLTENCRDVRGDRGGPSIEWSSIGRAIARAGDAARAESTKLLVTAGTGDVFLKDLWASGARVDAIDVHVYREGCGLPSRRSLALAVGDPAVAELPLIAGECGLASKEADAMDLENYVYNADREGYEAAFLWKLEGELVDTSSAPRPFTALARSVRHSLETRPLDGFVE